MKYKVVKKYYKPIRIAIGTVMVALGIYFHQENIETTLLDCLIINSTFLNCLLILDFTLFYDLSAYADTRKFVDLPIARTNLFRKEFKGYFGNTSFLFFIVSFIFLNTITVLNYLNSASLITTCLIACFTGLGILLFIFFLFALKNNYSVERFRHKISVNLPSVFILTHILFANLASRITFVKSMFLSNPLVNALALTGQLGNKIQFTSLGVFVLLTCITIFLYKKAVSKWIEG